MRQPCIVKLLRPGQSCLKGTAIGTFVAHGPDDHRRAVFIPLHTELRPVHRCPDKIRVIGDHFVPVQTLGIPVFRLHIACAGAMAFVVSFVDDIKSQPVIQFIKMRCIWIMAGTDSIYIMFLHEPQIFHDLFLADDKSRHRITVMAIDAAELHLLSVDIQYISFYVNLPEADVIGDHLPGISAGSLIHHGIQVRLLGVPEVRMLYFHVQASIFRLLLRHQIAGSIQQPTADRNYLIEKFECDINLTCIMLLASRCLS